MKVHELVNRFAVAADAPDSLNAVKGVLESLRGELNEVATALEYISGVGGNARQVFYRAPNLTLLKVCFPCGRRTPPHDHGTWAAILVLSGEEKNTLYRRENGRLRKASEVTLETGSVLGLRAETPHVAECIGDKPVLGLHVYGGDIFELPRHMWNPQTLEEHPLEWTTYEQFARTASSAQSAP